MRIAIPLRLGALLALPLFIAACDAATDAPAPDGLTEGERDRLEAAAARIDSRPAGPGADDAAALEAETRDRLAAERAQAADPR